jgi:hypothetical protein
VLGHVAIVLVLGATVVLVRMVKVECNSTVVQVIGCRGLNRATSTVSGRVQAWIGTAAAEAAGVQLSRALDLFLSSKANTDQFCCIQEYARTSSQVPPLPPPPPLPLPPQGRYLLPTTHRWLPTGIHDSLDLKMQIQKDMS